MPRVTRGSSIPNAPVASCSAAIFEDVLVHVLARGVDVGIRRDDEHDVVRWPIEGDRRERDRGRRVATHRLEQQGGFGELVADQALVATVGHDRDVVGQPPQPPLRRLEQGLVAEQRQEGLRALGPAQGVESGPTAAGHDDGVHVAVIVAPREGRGPGRHWAMTTHLPSQIDLALPLVIAREVRLELGRGQVAVRPLVRRRAQRPADVEAQDGLLRRLDRVVAGSIAEDDPGVGPVLDGHADRVLVARDRLDDVVERLLLVRVRPRRVHRGAAREVAQAPRPALRIVAARPVVVAIVFADLLVIELLGPVAAVGRAADEVDHGLRGRRHAPVVRVLADHRGRAVEVDLRDDRGAARGRAGRRRRGRGRRRRRGGRGSRRRGGGGARGRGRRGRRARCRGRAGPRSGPRSGPARASARGWAQPWARASARAGSSAAATAHGIDPSIDRPETGGQEPAADAGQHFPSCVHRVSLRQRKCRPVPVEGPRATRHDGPAGATAHRVRSSAASGRRARWPDHRRGWRSSAGGATGT